MNWNHLKFRENWRNWGVMGLYVSVKCHIRTCLHFGLYFPAVSADFKYDHWVLQLPAPDQSQSLDN